VDGPTLFFADRTLLVDRVAQYVHDTAQGRGTDRYLDGLAAVNYFQPTTQTVGGTHGDATHDAAADLLLNFQYQTLAWPSLTTFSASYTWGTAFCGNSMSTTAPMI
jgi:hypothetical protein